jgi:hypothetical protein
MQTIVGGIISPPWASLTDSRAGNVLRVTSES